MTRELGRKGEMGVAIPRRFGLVRGDPHGDEGDGLTFSLRERVAGGVRGTEGRSDMFC